MNCVARRGSQHLLADGDKGVIWDTKADTRSKPLRVQSILARGYWEDCTEHGPPELKHGNKDDPLYRTLYHPGPTQGVTATRPRSIYRRLDDPETGVRPEFDFAEGETVLWRGEQQLVDDLGSNPRFVKLRHPVFRTSQWVLREQVSKDTPENLAIQQADPIVVATAKIRKLTERTTKHTIDRADVDIWQMDPEFADKLVETLAAEYERHPILASTIKRIEVKQLTVRTRMAEWDQREKTLSLNSDYFGKDKYAATLDSLWKQADKGLHPKSMLGIRGVVTHEIAHALHGNHPEMVRRQSGLTFNAELAKALSDKGLKVTGVDSYIGPQFTDGQEAIAEGISNYANYSWAELIAEAYADYRAEGPDQSELVTLIGSMLDEAVPEWWVGRSEIGYNEGMGMAAIEARP